MVPPVARYPTTSDGGGAILCPAGEALVARLVEHPIVELPLDVVAVGSLGARLKGTATLAAGLGEVQQEGGTVATDHLGAVDQDLSHPLGVTHEGGEAAGGDDLGHGSGAGGGGGLSPSLERILQHRGRLSRVCSQNRDTSETVHSGAILGLGVCSLEGGRGGNP